MARTSRLSASRRTCRARSATAIAKAKLTPKFIKPMQTIPQAGRRYSIGGRAVPDCAISEKVSDAVESVTCLTSSGSPKKLPRMGVKAKRMPRERLLPNGEIW